MARDFYETTIALPDGAGIVKALADVRVSVVPRGASDVAGSLVDIFVADTGVAERPNPIVTTTNGSVRFWADGPAEYDLVFEDTITPARIADRYGWNCIPAKALPTSALVPDGGITQAHLAPAVINNEVPIGGVIDWWRPQQSVPVPTGFVICDGRAVPAGQHDFPGVAGGVNTPDLRHCFILGADSAKADGTGAAGNDDVVTSAPGVRGVGGSNRHLLAHNESGVNANGSTTTSGSHGHSPVQGRDPGVAPSTGAQVGPTYFDGLNAVYMGITADGSLHSHPLTGRTADVAHNNMPKWVGLLRIMKVKR